MTIRSLNRRLAAVAVMTAIAGSAQAQTAFRGDCEQARTFASSLTFQNAYRGVQRITATTDPCGRDVVAAYNLSLRPGASADYDMVGRYYYLWPTTGGACAEEVFNRLSGVARITQKVQTVGLICEVSLILEFDIANDERYGPNKFSKLITLVGADTSRFAATLPGSTEAMVFYQAPVSMVNPVQPMNPRVFGQDFSPGGFDGRQGPPPWAGPPWGRPGF